MRPTGGNRRRSKRIIRSGLRARIDGSDLPVQNCSLDGLMVGECTIWLRQGERLMVSLYRTADPDNRVHAYARVTWTDRELQHAGLKLESRPEAVIDLLDSLHQPHPPRPARWRGR